jgi:hypothetical protein
MAALYFRRMPLPRTPLNRKLSATVALSPPTATLRPSRPPSLPRPRSALRGATTPPIPPAPEVPRTFRKLVLSRRARRAYGVDPRVLGVASPFAPASRAVVVAERWGPPVCSPRETCASCFRGWRVLVWKEGRWPSCAFTRRSVSHATNASYACMRKMYVLHSSKDAPELLRMPLRRSSVEPRSDGRVFSGVVAPLRVACYRELLRTGG